MTVPSKLNRDLDCQRESTTAPRKRGFNTLLRAMAGRGAIEDANSEPLITVAISRGLAERQGDRTVTLTGAGWRYLQDLDADPYFN